MLKKLFIAFLILILVGSLAVAGVVTWAYYYFTRDLPSIANIDDYRPPAVTSVYSNDGTLIAEFYVERRYPVKLSQVPLLVQHAFLAAEDVNFYNHQGIDPVSIIRAMVRNLQSGTAKQGASTITQQIVKNLLLTPERKLERKIKEAILSYQLERKLSKDEILEIYLNQIFLGDNSYGIKAAARAYYRKELSELTIAEAAILAGLPQAPSRYSPVLHPDRAKRRQRYVLGQMVRGGFITQDQADAAEREKIHFYSAPSQNIYRAPYYVAEVRRLLLEWKSDIDIDRDGLEIHTALDLNADEMAQAALRKGLKEVDKRRGWRGPKESLLGEEKFHERYDSLVPTGALVPEDVYPALVVELARATGIAKVKLGNVVGEVGLKDVAWAKKKRSTDDSTLAVKPEELVRVGDVIEVSLPKEATKDTKGGSNAALKPVQLVLDQTPDIEGATVLVEPDSGKVLTTIGGYSYQRSVFNRATQALRQPGSTFKPVVYLTAVDQFKYTPSTIVHDAPRVFRVGDEFWSPANFDENYMGAITLRTALEKSRNLVSADIVSRIGVDAVIKTARRLGITSHLGRNLSLALGSSEVTLLEMTRAYGVFAARGVLFNSTFITKVADRDGQVLFDFEADKLTRAKQVINENSAFIMANLMKGVVEHGTGYRVKALGRPVAGKTGTSNDQMDAWFIGYTPEWACGVWVGFDQKKEIGPKETGGVVAAPVWLYFMSDFLALRDKIDYARLEESAKAEAEKLGVDYEKPEPLKALDFSVPDGVDPFWVDKSTGLLTEPGSSNAIYEYFMRGTEPGRRSESQDSSREYLESPDM